MKRLLSFAAVIVLLLSCRGGRDQKSVDELKNRVSVRTINLYFEGPGLTLVPEQRTLQLPENDAAAIAPIVRELLKGSTNPAVARLFPPDVGLRGAFLLPEGTGIVDLGGATLTTGWNTGSHAELIAAYGISETVTRNLGSVKRVRLLVNGQPAETLGGHIGIDRPLSTLR